MSIDLDLQEAMSDSAFELSSETASLSSYPSAQDLTPASQDKAIKRGRHASLTARLFAGLSGSILSSPPTTTASPNPPLSPNHSKTDTRHNRSDSIDSVLSAALVSPSHSSEGARKSNASQAGFSDWAGSVLPWRTQKQSKGLDVIGGSEITVTETDAETTEPDTPLAHDSKTKWASEETERLSPDDTGSSSGSTTQGTSVASSSKRTNGTAPTVPSLFSNDLAASPPTTSALLPVVPVSSSKPSANVITTLISKRQIDNPVISVPTPPIAAMSNPASLTSTPMVATFSSRSSSASGISELVVSVQSRSFPKKEETGPAHFRAVSLAADKWISGDKEQQILVASKRRSVNVTSWAISLVNNLASRQSASAFTSRVHATSASNGSSNVSAVFATAKSDSQLSPNLPTAKESLDRALRLEISGTTARRASQEPMSASRSRLERSRIVEPAVTLPTLGLTRQNSVFQAALSQPVGSMPAIIKSQIASAGPSPSAGPTSVELDTILPGEARPPTFGAPEDLEGMEDLVDRYGFMHEKNGMKVLRELRQRQQDRVEQNKENASPDPNETTISVLPVDDSTQSVKRLLAQLAEMNQSQEKVQQAAWDAYLKRRRAKLATSADPATVARTKDRPQVKNTSTLANQSGGPLADHDALYVEESAWSENLIGVAQMGTGGKAEKDAWRDFKLLVRSGIPISYRPAVWAELSGATEVREPGYYAELLQLHEEGAPNLCLKQISMFSRFTDVPETDKSQMRMLVGRLAVTVSGSFKSTDED